MRRFDDWRVSRQQNWKGSNMCSHSFVSTEWTCSAKPSLFILGSTNGVSKWLRTSPSIRNYSFKAPSELSTQSESEYTVKLLVLTLSSGINAWSSSVFQNLWTSKHAVWNAYPAFWKVEVDVTWNESSAQIYWYFFFQMQNRFSLYRNRLTIPKARTIIVI